jgi:hypothetical protein
VRKIVIVLLIFFAFGVKAQVKEHFNLFTDRDFYTSGETILFNVFVPDNESSEIIKIDLINSQGKIITEVNKKIKEHRADGFLYLTDSLKTGTYLLCTSTNESLEATVKELFICNRFLGLTETTSILQASATIALQEKLLEGVRIDGLNKSYKTREKVNGSINIPLELLSQIKHSLFVSVAEIIPGYSRQTFPMNTDPQKNRLHLNLGIVLEGYAKDSRTGAPFQKGCIMLSIPDTIPWIDYYITGLDGFFSFQLNNYYGRIPVVIQGYDLDKKQLLKINLNHVDSLPTFVPGFEKRILSPDLQTFAVENIEATTLRKIYDSQEINNEPIPSEIKHKYPFYGVPTEIVYPKLFIDLPDFTEISREILPGIKFRAYNRIPTLQILNPATLNYFNDPPLVTVDGVPVRDLNVIKNLGSKDIEKIEICRKERYYGDLVFPGVVAIYLVKPDYKLLPESDELIRLELDALQQGVSLNEMQNLKQNEPDLRKVLLWNPSLNPGQELKFEFSTSDIHGNFKLMVRGKREDGSVIYTEQTFEVK